MAMTIVNDPARTKSLGQLNKNINDMGKILAQASSGMKINGAKDDASGFSISEKMRTQLRSLEQDIQNVKTGRNLIRVAAGGIDEIVQELKSLKELAINAANDHNSDIDRVILQKEFDQRMENIDDIASTTNYNGKLLLNGDYERWHKGLVLEGGGGGELEPSPPVPDQPHPVEPNDPPTLIDQSYTIRTAGVYVLGPNFTGTINIENDLVGVKIQQATPAQLTNVYINGPSNGKANLWIDGLNIKNTTADSWIRFSGSDNVLTIKGNNTYVNDCSLEKAGINIGGGLTIQGKGTLDFHQSKLTYGALIGTDSGENSSANLTINSGTYILTAANKREGTRDGGAQGGCIGSGLSGSMGDIIINGGNFDLFDTGGGPGIGSGERGRSGDISIRNAKVKAVTDDGACIGGGFSGSCGDIIIENSEIDVDCRKTYVGAYIPPTNNGDGAGIGSGGNGSRAGNITIRNSTVNASSNYGAGIGSGYASHVGDIKIVSSKVNAICHQEEGDDIGKGVKGTCGNVEQDGGIPDDGNYREITVLGTPLVIHNGTKSNRALHCFIPNMHTKNMGLENIRVITQEKAQQLLGDKHNPNVPGILDKAINYALDAATEMGAYIQELDASEETLTINNENTQAAESTIRDADMARTMMEYAKSNILSQSSQAMLAQANQSSAGVLSLLG